MPNVDQARRLVVTILVSLLVGCTPSDTTPPAERTPETHVPLETADEPVDLLAELNRLPARLRAVVVLCYLEGLTYDAAARVDSLSPRIAGLAARSSSARRGPG